ncbi:MAG: phosphoribosylformylglycinamidine synthase subunit PurL [Bacteroidota bacterium]|jgi:phosphoribosylformylglycinamidine synthase II
MEITVQTAAELRLTEEEFRSICEKLNRTPNFTELCAFSGMWSEHCSYKNSIRWLKTLPRSGGRMLVAAGEENAGLMDMGNGYGVVFKIESHNHPSAIEPFQGAATGVGGIQRDIFTMGARPIASLNSLRFGLPEDKKTKRLLSGVVHGIGHYGNCFGVPTVGGEVYFDACYHTNPLVNAMSVGIVPVNKTVSAIAQGTGNPVFFVGSATGKDGIGGASFASANITEESTEELPAVQVGDPFQEKKLLEACLEVIETGAVVGMQDMGAAGIICSTAEMSAKGGVGMHIDLEKVPTRQKNMKAWELLLSESQERMLLVAEKGREAEVIKVFEKWDLSCNEIGHVTDDGLLQFYMHGQLEASIPAHELVLGGGAPQYERSYTAPAYLEQINGFQIDEVADVTDLRTTAHQLNRLPNIASKRWIYTQYDSMVGAATVTTNAPSDASVVVAKGTGKSLAMTVDCNSRYVHANPYTGAMIAVAEAARNIVCSGAEPIGVTNCLNFGNPYDPQVYYQFVNAIQGMGDACRAFQTPVTGGNVSFYNQNPDGPVFPTPTIGMVGILDEFSHHLTLHFKQPGDLIFLVGKVVNDIACSEYLYQLKKVTYSPAPYFQLEEEMAAQDFIKVANQQNILQSAHDLSEGGLIISLLESGYTKQLGFQVAGTPAAFRTDAFWLGEAQGRILISISPNQKKALVQLASEKGIPLLELGVVSGTDVIIGNDNWGNIADWKNEYDTAIETIMQSNTL